MVLPVLPPRSFDVLAQLPDVRVLNACARGDDSGFGAFAERWTPAMERVVRGYLAARGRLDEDDVQDLVNFGLLRIWKRAGSYDPSRGTPAAFVIYHARQAARRRQRVYLQREELVMSEAGEARFRNTPSTLPTPDAEHQRAELAALLWTAVDLLPAKEREVVIGRYQEGLDLGDLAELLGVAPVTVSNRLHAGLARLKAMLTDFVHPCAGVLA